MSEKEKIGIIRIPSDDLATQKNGWVEFSARLKVKHLPYVEVVEASDVLKNGNARDREESLGPFYELLSILVEDWNWEDREGVAYPKPHRNAEVFGELRPAEFNWVREKALEALKEQAEIPKPNGTPS